MPEADFEVLLVEDEPALREQLARLIESWGYRVRIEHDVDGALAAVEHALPDIILTDLVMPARSGHELLASVFSRWPDLPVLVMTAFATLESAVDALKHGAYDYLLKPFTPQELSAALIRARSTIALRRLREREERLRHVTAVALTLTHEINNPLAVITGELQLMIEDGVAGPEERRAIEICLQSAQRIAEVVRKVAALGEVVYHEYGGMRLLDLTSGAESRERGDAGARSNGQ